MNHVHGVDVLGALADGVDEYNWGEGKVLQLVQFFNSLGRPAEFEPAVQALYADYERNKALFNDGLLKWQKATGMKRVGGEAVSMMEKIQKAKAAAPGKVPAAVVPSGISNPVFTPNAPPIPSFHVPWWVYAIGGTAVVGAGVFYFGKHFTPAGRAFSFLRNRRAEA